MDAKIIRGKVPLNINDQSSLYGQKKKLLNVDLHINKNHNIFEDGYTQNKLSHPLQQSTIPKSPYQQLDYNDYNGFKSLNQSQSQNQRSPTKSFKLGAHLNPNQVDPRLLTEDKSPPAGVGSNYGIAQPFKSTPSQGLYSPDFNQIRSQSELNNSRQQREFSGLGYAGNQLIHGQNDSYNNLPKKDLNKNFTNDYLKASGLTANSGNIGIESIKFNKHYHQIGTENAVPGTRKQQESDLNVNNYSLGGGGTAILKPGFGRHDQNPSAQKNMHFLKSAQKRNMNYGSQDEVDQTRRLSTLQEQERNIQDQMRYNQQRNSGNYHQLRNQVGNNQDDYGNEDNYKNDGQTEETPNNFQEQEENTQFNSYDKGTPQQENPTLYRRFEDEKMLIEQDPFLLEEQRYLNRMQKAMNVQEDRYKLHYKGVLIPEVEKKKKLEEQENEIIEKRMKSLAQAAERQAQMKEELNKLQSSAIRRQIDSRYTLQKEQEFEKQVARKQMDRQVEMLRNFKQQNVITKQLEQQQYRDFLHKQIN